MIIKGCNLVAKTELGPQRWYKPSLSVSLVLLRLVAMLIIYFKIFIKYRLDTSLLFVSHSI